MPCKICGEPSGAKRLCPACDREADKLTARKLEERGKRKKDRYVNRLMLAGGAVR